MTKAAQDATRVRAVQMSEVSKPVSIVRRQSLWIWISCLVVRPVPFGTAVPTQHLPADTTTASPVRTAVKCLTVDYSLSSAGLSPLA